MSSREILYMAVTADEYELPLYVTPSVFALARWAGKKTKSINEQISKGRNKPPRKVIHNYTGYRYRRVYIEEETE